MSEEILINVTPQETRVATVENGVVTEVWVERKSKETLVGNIYMGKIVRVLPGMDAAFVEVGLERAAFLHASDIAVLLSIVTAKSLTSQFVSCCRKVSSNLFR